MAENSVNVAENSAGEKENVAENSVIVAENSAREIENVAENSAMWPSFWQKEKKMCLRFQQKNYGVANLISKHERGENLVLHDQLYA